MRACACLYPECAEAGFCLAYYTDIRDRDYPQIMEREEVRRLEAQKPWGSFAAMDRVARELNR